MMKQATMEMWYGFCQRMKTLKGWAMLVGVGIAFLLYTPDLKSRYLTEIFYLPMLMGMFVAFFCGSNTGKLSMVLPIDSKEYKKLIYAKTFWVVIIDLVYIVLGAIVCHIKINTMEIIFLAVIPVLMLSAFSFIGCILPCKNALYDEKGYSFPVWLFVLGMLCVLIGFSAVLHGKIIVKLVYAIVVYGILFVAIWKIERKLFCQRVYYDEIEKLAKRLHW